MAENGSNSGRGRPAHNLPAKVWGAYFEALGEQGHWPVRKIKELKARLAPLGMTPDHIGKILSGSRDTPPGFRDLLAEALELARIGLTSADLDLDLEAFKSKLKRNETSSLAQQLEKGRDGTRLELKPLPRKPVSYRHFGAKQVPPVGITANQTHMLLIHRSPDRTSADEGYLLLLSYGLKDQKWQLVSSVADPPHSPDLLSQWSGLSSNIALTAPLLLGEFILYAVGSPRTFPSGLASVYESLIDTDGFLADRERILVEEAVTFGLNHGAWTAALHYVMQ